MTRPKILYPYSTIRTEIPDHLPEFQQFLLDFEVIFYPISTQQHFIQALQSRFNDIQGLYATEAMFELFPFRDLIPHFPETLRVFAYPWVGFNLWEPEMMKQKGIIMTNIGDAAAPDVADIALQLTLSVFRFTPFIQEKLRTIAKFDQVQLYFGGSAVDSEGEPHKLGPNDDASKRCTIGGKDVSSPRGKVAGIVGLGTIGKEIAIRLNAIGLKIKYHKRTPLADEELANFHFKLDYVSSVNELIPQVDLLVLAVPQTPETIDLINKDTIKLFRRGARIVNIGRGSAIDEDVLLKALDDGTITSFGADVLRNEPDMDPRFRDRFDVNILPHIGPFTNENFAISNIRVIENFRNILLEGGKGLNVCGV
ncbi:hypothetical protein WICPIJ_005562 [Wickerhamomyces pijperi]|uniref:D-isomer specific 2-hydroxyacid dehydrogenase NAD-binding domain-containing protein n=1 Tax=Wickerhamomyces pijperi TaxID=599730 RepID=A0A9P8TL06_WICPI|nr:hypothetical protein WICPIJ_005562 [Wickerhamomyces pijperi]